MRLANSRFACIAVFILAGCVTIASAPQATGGSQQKANDPKNVPRVTLGSSDGTPGGSVVVPIYFAPEEGVEVGQLKLDINFVSRSLKYSRINRGLAAESGNVDVHAELKEGKNDKGLETTALTIAASIPAPKPGQKGIPSGLLGYITLQVSEKAGPANITLHTTAEAAELETKKPIQNLQTSDGLVDILAPGSEPLVSCFFFTH